MATASGKIWESAQWQKLAAHAPAVKAIHLREMLQDAERFGKLSAQAGDNFTLDFSRQQVTDETMELLWDLAEQAGLREKIQAMANGEHLNTTEDRAVMHMALRAPSGYEMKVIWVAYLRTYIRM